MLADYHIHTKRCKHARGEMREYVEQALAMRIPEIAFTDHIPLPDNFDLAHRMAMSELEGYLSEIEALQKEYPQIRILSGIEADYYEGFEEFLQRILSQFPFDLIIMSVHFIKGWGENNWVFSYHFPDRPLHDIYSDYLRTLGKGVDTGLFHVLGHLDLIKSPDSSILEHNLEEIQSLLERIKKQNMAIEINTSGLRKEVAETYPTLKLIPLIRDFNIPLTMGSDAHQPDQVGYCFRQLEEELKPFAQLTFRRYRSGKPIEYTLTITGEV